MNDVAIVFTYGPILLGAIFALQTAARVVGERRFERLRSWEMQGIPLPAPDDPRWRLTKHGEAEMGPFLVQEYLNEFATGGVWFEKRCLGNWRRYERAVMAPLTRRLQEERAARALAAITGDEP